MALPAYKILTGNNTDELENKVKGAVSVNPNLVLYGPAQYSEGARQWFQTLLEGNSIAEGGGSVAAQDIIDATGIGLALLLAESGADAREAIGAGTSSLVLGETADTALAGDYAPALEDITDMSASARELNIQPNYTAMRTLLDLGDFSTADVATAAELLGLGPLATAMASELAESLATAPNAATARNVLELGQLATLNEVTASHISDNTITDAEVSPDANLAATKIRIETPADPVTTGIAAPANLQATIEALAARITALEP